MKTSSIFFLIVFSICFITSWMLYIFWLEKDEFDIEFREKAKSSAIILDLGTDVVLEENYNERKAIEHEVNYVEYKYIVDGREYTYGNRYFDDSYSASDTIQIEYVISNPNNSRVLGLGKHSFNYFVRHLIMVSIISFILMFGVLAVLDFFHKSERLRDLVDNFR